MPFPRAVELNSVSTVCLHVTDLVTLIDLTTATLLLEFVDNFKRTGRGIATIVGLDRPKARSHADAAMRVSLPLLAQERAKPFDVLARISLTRVDAGTPDPVVYLEQLSLIHVGANRGEREHLFTRAVVQAATYLARTRKTDSNLRAFSSLISTKKSMSPVIRG